MEFDYDFFQNYIKGIFFTIISFKFVLKGIFNEFHFQSDISTDYCYKIWNDFQLTFK